MTRVVLHIDAMGATAAKLAVMAEDVNTIGTAVRVAELPPMPAELQARFADGARSIAARTTALAEPLAGLAAELRRRAAGAVHAQDDRQGGRRIAAALAPTGGVEVLSASAPAVVTDAPAPATVGAHEAIGHHAAHAVHDALHGGRAPDGDATLRATAHDGLGGAPLPHTPADHADAQRWACWMATHAAHEGLAPTAPIALALANSGMRNLEGQGGGVGFFGIAPGQDVAPAGFGLGATTQPDAAWWRTNPEAQLAHVLRGLAATAPRDTPAAPADLGAWIAGAEPHTDADAVTTALSTARTLVARCRHGLAAPEAPEHPDHDALLRMARTQLGVHETSGANAGPQVDRFLAAAGVAPGNPWCASFVTWAMRQAGHPMHGPGWAAVSHWVGSAQAHADGLSLVSAQDARPGDIVAYDWGGGTDFGSDGHIGILAGTVAHDGAFTAVEGNAGDAVSEMHRHLGEANVVFIRASGGPA